jgi:hypothetical protein
MDQSFFATIVELAKIGSAGVGVAVLLMVFILIMKGKPVDPDTAKLRERFLTFGVGFAVVVGLFALVPALFPAEGGPTAMRLTFSPDFQTESLTPPTIMMPDGTVVKPDQPVSLPSTRGTQVLKITIDEALKEVGSLREASAALAASVASVTQQRDTLAKEVAPQAAAPAAQQTLETQTQQTQQLQTEVAKSIQSGDFGRANAFSSRLHQSVVASRPVIAQIVAPHH